MTPEQEVYRANRANEVLQNEVYVGAYEAIRDEFKLQWMNSPARDVEGREKLWLMLHLLNKVQLCLQATMEGGKVAKAELEHRQTVLERMQDYLR